MMFWANGYAVVEPWHVLYLISILWSASILLFALIADGYRQGQGLPSSSWCLLGSIGGLLAYLFPIGPFLLVCLHASISRWHPFQQAS